MDNKAETNYNNILYMLENATRNVEKVYNSGYKNGLSDSGYYDGRQEEYDAIWDTIQNKGKRTDYSNAFSNWTGDYFCPKYKIVPTADGGAKNIFYYFRAAKKLLAKDIDLSKLPRGTNTAKGLAYSFCSMGTLEEIEDIGLSPSTSYEYAFAFNQKLKKIAKITVDNKTVFSEAFRQCLALEEIYFEGVIGENIDFQWSTKLKKECITNIIEHLSDDADLKILTLSKKAVDEAFKFWFCTDSSNPEEGYWIEGTQLAEWEYLVASKPNWTIALI